jgi:hypothetical protein
MNTTIGLSGCPNPDCPNDAFVITLTDDVSAVYCSACGAPGPMLWQKQAATLPEGGTP